MKNRLPSFIFKVIRDSFPTFLKGKDSNLQKMVKLEISGGFDPYSYDFIEYSLDLVSIGYFMSNGFYSQATRRIIYSIESGLTEEEFEKVQGDWEDKVACFNKGLKYENII